MYFFAQSVTMPFNVTTMLTDAITLLAGSLGTIVPLALGIALIYWGMNYAKRVMEECTASDTQIARLENGYELEDLASSLGGHSSGMQFATDEDLEDWYLDHTSTDWQADEADFEDIEFPSESYASELRDNYGVVDVDDQYFDDYLISYQENTLGDTEGDMC